MRMSLSFETMSQKDLTNKILDDAAVLFREHYGVWASGTLLEGNRIKINPKRLRDRYLPDHADCSYTRALLDGRLLVVHTQYRNQGIATRLLRLSRADSDDIYGILSSHPFSCMAAATSFGDSIINPPLDFTRQHAQEVLKASPIDYVAAAVVKGSLFGNDSTDLVSGADTQFFISHEEPDAAMNDALSQGRWPLGNLPEGHEYVLVLPAKTTK